jgi:regulator of cell morphogenesis and NO signaling
LSQPLLRELRCLRAPAWCIRFAARRKIRVDGPDWTSRPAHKLIDHVVSRHHDRMRRDFPHVVEAVRKVERVHSGEPAVTIGLAEEIDAFWSDMQSHIEKEEGVLFRAIVAVRAGRRSPCPFA